MKILIDSAIPYINGVLEPYFDVTYKKGIEITADDVSLCDALIVRTRTRCDSRLLDGSRVRFIGTATIGFDHIDMEYCTTKGIKVVTAIGCNALGVVQYVAAAIAELEKLRAIRTVGIVGVGNVGGALSNYLTKLGYRVLQNDPPRATTEADFCNTPLTTLLEESDLVTLHTLLDETTRGMVSTDFFTQLGYEKFFINASRGEVVDESALLSAIDDCRIINPVIDVWSNEPNINRLLLERAFIATPHIAGYSQQGKANGTAMMIVALADYFDIEELRHWYPSEVQKNINGEVTAINYNILADSNSLKESAETFEEQRNRYNYRKEFF